MKKRLEIDSSDIKKLKEFFEEHYDYTITELAFKYGIPPSTLRYWRRKAGIFVKKPEAFTAVNKKKDVEVIDDPKVWDNAAWFQEHYVNQRIGAYIIARMIKRSRIVVYRRLERYGIQRRNHHEATKTLNKYCDRQWLIDNYFRQRRSLRSMAKEAGVSEFTVSNWMVGLKLLPRDRNASSVAASDKRRWNKRTEG